MGKYGIADDESGYGTEKNIKLTELMDKKMKRK